MSPYQEKRVEGELRSHRIHSCTLRENKIFLFEGCCSIALKKLLNSYYNIGETKGSRVTSLRLVFH